MYRMTITFYCYSGTGNTLWAARALSAHIPTAEIVPYPENPAAHTLPADGVFGFFFPVHMWGPPRRVLTFLNTVSLPTEAYYFAVAVNAGQVATTLTVVEKRLKTHGITLSLGLDLVMPTNYIPWGDVAPIAAQQQRFETAKQKIAQAAPLIQSRQRGAVDRGKFWHSVVFPPLNKLSTPHIPEMDNNFWVTETCNGCGICAKICPPQNIEMKNKQPVWHHTCEQCLACLNLCPNRACQYGKKTIKYGRYHHPEIRALDLIKLHHPEDANLHVPT